MATKKLFSNKSKSNSKVFKIQPTNTVNEASGKAYSLDDKTALAQLVVTGCFNGTYYASDEEQLEKVLELANKVEPEFLAKLAVFARQKAFMKDTPALLAAVLASKDSQLLAKVFHKIVDDPKMIRNFVQMKRSGITGHKSLGTVSKRLVQRFLENLTDEQLFKANVGNSPSLQDIIKLTHPKPTNKKRSALYGYLLGKEHNKKDLCQLVKDFENFKKEMGPEIPDVPFQLLTALPLKDSHWKQIASNATFNQTRMNLNTFARHNVLKDANMVSVLADKLSDPEQAKKAKVLPYQLFAAYLNADSTIPSGLINALQDAADNALVNVPDFGSVAVLVDVSGSMESPATGNRGSATSKMSCVQVAALFASAILRKNPNAEIVPFDTSVHVSQRLNPRDSIMTNSKILAKFGGGGTDCASAVHYLNGKNAKHDLVVMISDNQSFLNGVSHTTGTSMSNEWAQYKKSNPKAKLVCWDIQPYTTTQGGNQDSVLNIGGFNGDTVFDTIAKFVEVGNDKNLWVQAIESVRL